jgi:hypothetical protein
LLGFIGVFGPTQRGARCPLARSVLLLLGLGGDLLGNLHLHLGFG